LCARSSTKPWPIDALGNPVNFFLTGGEAHDLVGADHLLPSMQADTLIADKAFDADERVIAPLAAAGKTAVIPPKANRRLPRDYDQYIYQARHLIENFFAKLKQFRAIATRYDKTALRANEDETWRCREFRFYLSESLTKSVQQSCCCCEGHAASRSTICWMALSAR
jgi:transposase